MFISLCYCIIFIKILGTVVSKYRKSAETGNIGFPTYDLQMSVDFRQSAAAIGRIPTNYFRREMQQTDQDIITSRIIDRSIRPIFLQNYTSLTHVLLFFKFIKFE